MSKFDDLYKLLIEKIIKNTKFYCDIMEHNIPYWGEIAKIRLTPKTMVYKNNRYYVDPIVIHVSDSNNELDYVYVPGEEPHLKVWLMRPDYEKCIIELEKTIFMLS